MATKWVYKFSEGNAEMRNLLGGKGANLIYQFLRDSQLQQKRAQTIMTAVERSVMK